jgi:hypothetical protein
MENISRGLALGDFVTIHTETSMQDIPVARLQFKCNLLRESFSVDSKNIPYAALLRRGSWVISVYLWTVPFLIPDVALVKTKR